MPDKPQINETPNRKPPQGGSGTAPANRLSYEDLERQCASWQANAIDLGKRVTEHHAEIKRLEDEVVYRMKANAELAFQIAKGLPTFIVAAPDPQETTPEEWQAAMDSLKKEGVRQQWVTLPDYDTGYLRQQINYWAYCTWRGMLLECPEKRDELTEFFTRLKLMPYANRK